VAKKVYKIEAFEGGINQKYDPRDIEDNQLEEAFNVDVSNPGRILMTGDGAADYVTLNSRGNLVSPAAENNLLLNAMNLTAGYGLFAFSHDYNMFGVDNSDGSSAAPVEVETDFLCINDGAHIHIWDACHTNADTTPGDLSNDDNDMWLTQAITLGKSHAVGDLGDVEFVEKVKPVYYKADNGLRVCDGQFCTQDTDVNCGNITSTVTDITTNGTVAHTLSTGEYVKISNEILKVIDATTSSTQFVAARGQFGTTPSAHNNESIYHINVPKVLSHINRPFLEKARLYTSTTAYTYGAAGIKVNKWQEDVQCLEPANDYSSSGQSYGLAVYDGKVTGMATEGTDNTTTNETVQAPDAPGKVLFSVHESNSADDKVIVCDTTSDGTVLNGLSTINISAVDTDLDFTKEGFTVGKFIIISGSTNIDGLAEIVAMGANSYTIAISAEFVAQETVDFTIRLEENSISEDLQNKYIFGMSFLYDGGGSEKQESPIKPGYVYSGLIPHKQAVGESITNWDTGTNADGTTSLDTSTTANWIHKDNTYFYDDNVATTDAIIYRSVSDDITAEQEYYVAISVTIGSHANCKLTIYPPGHKNSGSSGGIIGDGTGDGSSVAINTSGNYLFKAKAPTSGDYDAVFVAIAADAAQSDETGDITIENVQVFSATPTEMDANNAIDMRGWEGIPKMFSGFNMNRSSQYLWNDRIAGYRIYMKQVDSATTTLAEEWLLALDVDFETGQYINYGNEAAEQYLHLGKDWEDDDSSTDAFIDSLVCTEKVGGDENGRSAMDTLRNIPLDTYESENGYKAETNTTAMYKTATVIDRKVFIGNLKIGEKTYPDRMIEAPTDRFDTFPDDGLHYIDVAVGDGDEIVKLESVGNKLIQFKKKHAYVIEVSSEGVDLLHTWPHKGIKAPCQVIAAGDGVVWANNNGLYYYDGKELKIITGETFESGTWVVNENESKPIILGYDEASNKVLILTTNVTGKNSGGYIYDIQNASLTECQNLFNWYPTVWQDIVTDVNQDGNIDILDIIYLGANPEDTDMEGIDMTSLYGAYMSNVVDADYLPISPANIYRTNMVNTKDRHLIMATNTSTQDTQANISTWDNRSRPLYNWNSSAEHFNVQTKDIDFGNVARRKKIYSIYVSFKAKSYMSGVIVKYATDGSNTFSGTFKDTTYYSNSKGFDAYNAGTSSDDWITVQLKPSVSINNIYSFQLQFSFASAGRLQALGGVSTTSQSVLTFDASASGTDDYYNGMPVYLYSGPGKGQQLQVTDYVGDTKVATIITPYDADDNNTLIHDVNTGTNFDVGHIPKEFAINDIAIVYREKSVK